MAEAIGFSVFEATLEIGDDTFKEFAKLVFIACIGAPEEDALNSFGEFFPRGFVIDIKVGAEFSNGASVIDFHTLAAVAPRFDGTGGECFVFVGDD